MAAFFLASWVGDVALLLAPEGPADVALLGVPKHGSWFLVGVGAFAVAHGALIGALRRVGEGASTGRAWWFGVPVAWMVAVGAAVLPEVASDPERRAALGPLVAYAALLVAMVGFALRRKGRVSEESFEVTLLGAAFFLVSDSTIGVVHLVHRGQVSGGGLAIMATYLAAEVLLGWGVLLQYGAQEVRTQSSAS
mgnify:CR=1 FL=1